MNLGPEPKPEDFSPVGLSMAGATAESVYGCRIGDNHSAASDEVLALRGSHTAALPVAPARPAHSHPQIHRHLYALYVLLMNIR